MPAIVADKTRPSLTDLTIQEFDQWPVPPERAGATLPLNWVCGSCYCTVETADWATP
jgi:hypothetical protein